MPDTTERCFQMFAVSKGEGGLFLSGNCLCVACPGALRRVTLASACLEGVALVLLG